MDIPSSGCWALVLRDMSVMRTGRGALLVRGEKDLSLASVCHAVLSVAPCITCRFVVKTHRERDFYAVFETRTCSGDSSVGRASD